MNIGFILYDSRSGSTFLSRQLHEFDDIYVTAESAFISRIIDGKIVQAKDVSAKKIIDFLNQEIHFLELKIDNQRLLNEINLLITNGELSNRNLIRLIINIQIKSNFKEQWILIKHPLFEHLNTIREMFPESKFIHIIRDPRGVHSSKKRSVNLEGKVFSNNALKTSLKYRYKVNKILDFQNNHKDMVHHIRYCDLLTKNKETLNKCLNFLKVSNSNKNNKSYFEEIGSNQKNLHTNVKSGAIEKKISSWKQELSKNEIAVISHYCKSLIYHFDFEKVTFSSFNVKISSLKLYAIYITTSIKNFVKISFKNPELLASKVRYFKTFIR